MKTIINISTFAPTDRNKKGETIYLNSLTNIEMYAFKNIYSFNYNHKLGDYDVTKKIYTYMKEKYSLTNKEFSLFKKEIDIDINNAICDSERDSYGINYYKALWKDLVEGIYITYPFAKGFKLIDKDKKSLELTRETSIIFQADITEATQVEIEYLKKDFNTWKKEKGYDTEIDIEEIEIERPRYDYKYSDSGWSCDSTEEEVIIIFKDYYNSEQTIEKYKKDIFIYGDIDKALKNNGWNFDEILNNSFYHIDLFNVIDFIYTERLFEEEPQVYIELNDEDIENNYWYSYYNTSIKDTFAPVIFNRSVPICKVTDLQDFVKLLNDYNRKAKFLKY